MLLTIRTRQVLVALATTVLLWIVACQPQSPPVPSSPVAEAERVVLNGAGATFPFPLYQRWLTEYSQEHPNVQINYQPIGSAAGIQQMIAETVDFGASDVAMTDTDMAQVERGVLLLPMTAGSVAIVYNLPGVEGLKLSRQVYPEIFLGKIIRWNDPQIAALNPELALPDQPITLIHRSDGSGTTAVFTNHLGAISPEWQNQVGSGLSVQWPAGIGVKSNAGVSAQVQQAEGTIGYVEYGYAQQLGLSVAALENAAGQHVLPDELLAANALNEVEIPEDLRIFVRDPESPDAYPIVTYSWLLVYQQYDDPQKAQALQEFIEWGLTAGQQFSQELGYVPLPAAVVEQAAERVAQLSS
ncbi:MAG: phosphate ABC transporter substrate-binding protein PstS [Cyanophyceae cyanobacterium]